MEFFRKYRSPALFFLCLAFVWAILSVGLFRALGSILTAFGEETFGSIFSSLQTAAILPPPVVLALGSAGITWVFFRLRKKSVFLAVTAGLLLFVLGAISVVLLTRVNGIRFSDLLFSLLKNIKNGLLDAM